MRGPAAGPRRWQRALGALLLLLLVAILACNLRFRHAVGPDEGRFVASKTGQTYHRPDCTLGKRIARRRLLYYKTGDDAYKDRFTPCRVCHPERGEGSPH